MDPHESYHHAITGAEAEKRLRGCGNHCYLTRYSEERKCYMLSVYQKMPNHVMKNFQITFQHYDENDKMYKIEGKTKEFGGLQEMLRYYEQKPIDPAFSNIGRCITEQEYISKWCTIL